MKCRTCSFGKLDLWFSNMITMTGYKSVRFILWKHLLYLYSTYFRFFQSRKNEVRNRRNIYNAKNTYSLCLHVITTALKHKRLKYNIQCGYTYKAILSKYLSWALHIEKKNRQSVFKVQTVIASLSGSVLVLLTTNIIFIVLSTLP